MEVFKRLGDAADTKLGRRLIKAPPGVDRSKIMAAGSFSNVMIVRAAAAVPVSEQTPNFSSKAGLQQHVHILVVFKRAI